MKNNEFVDTYSDDIIYLIEARKALIKDPMVNNFESLCTASLSRILIVFTIGTIEAALEHWNEDDQTGILENYFQSNCSNKQRIESLENAFNDKGIIVDEDIFKDFLAIKYLRNTIVHASWTQQGKEYVVEREFPTDTRQLNEGHWKKIVTVHDNMLMYLGITKISSLTSFSGKVETKKYQESELRKVFKRRDVAFVYWSNMERINWIIQDYVQLYVKDHGSVEQENIYKIFDKNSDYALEFDFFDAIQSWDEYKRLTFDLASITKEQLVFCKKVLLSLHKNNNYPVMQSFITPQNVPSEFVKNYESDYLQHIFKGEKEYSTSNIHEALSTGENVYWMSKNDTAINMLVNVLPVAFSNQVEDLSERAEFALLAFQVRELWYWFVERKESPTSSFWLSYSLESVT
ncbi:hypothetical protein ABXV22_25355 [Vibrio rotiferianus]|uniref:hypothetical protein n=1 Tax=Vibrio rotiferianus TaxID=190895 RepID=UPI00339A4020